MSKKSTGRCQSADSIASFGEAQSPVKSSVSPLSMTEDSSGSSFGEEAASIYWTNLEYIRQKYLGNEHIEDSPRLFEPMIAFMENERCKTHSGRFLSTVRTLHIIEEKDELSTENSEEKPPKNSVNIIDHNSENCRTPRFYEVPPKRLCTRPQTPKFDYKLMNHKDLCAKEPSASSVFNKSKCASAESCVEDLTLSLGELNIKQSLSNDPSFLSESKRESSGCSSSWPSENNLRINLPSSVIDDPKSKTATIEPKIIILDSDRSPKGKMKKNDFGKGDYFSNPKESILMKYWEFTPEISTISTPSYTVSPILSDRAVQTDLMSHHVNRIYSQTELNEVEIKTIEPEPDSGEAWAETVGDLKKLDYENLRDLKSLILNFADGVKVTRMFPDNFQDIKEDNCSSFKDKGTELLQSASYKSHSVNHREISTITNVVDERKNQAIDLDYYAMSSTSSEREENRTGLEIEDILLEERDESGCCSCFGFGRFTFRSKRTIFSFPK